MHPAKPKQKVFAVASFGGHLVQLLRIMSKLSGKYDICYASTSDKAKSAVGDAKLYVVEDFSRTSPFVLFRTVKQFRRLMQQEKPAVVISTGAAPGLSAIIAARSLGIKTMWIDSIANAEKLSMCGVLAKHIAGSTLTQWPHLAKGKVKFMGNVIDN